MMRIEKLESGFCALWDGERLIDAALIKWDGKRGTKWEYDVSGECQYYIDAENNVYYSMPGGDTGIWCSAKDLSMHCHRIQQILARR